MRGQGGSNLIFVPWNVTSSAPVTSVASRAIISSVNTIRSSYVAYAW